VWEWPDLEVEGGGTTEIFRQIGLPSRRLRYGGELAALRLVVVLVGLSPRKLFAPLCSLPKYSGEIFL
jgi:hypothetical protein